MHTPFFRLLVIVFTFFRPKSQGLGRMALRNTVAYHRLLTNALLFWCGWCPAPAIGQSLQNCRAVLKDDTLVVENELIARHYSWNNGNLISRSVTDKKSGTAWKMTGNKPDLSLPGQTDKAQRATFSAKVIPQTSVAYEHLEAEVIYMLDNVEVKRVFRVYPTVAAIACDLYFRGESKKVWSQHPVRSSTNER